LQCSSLSEKEKVHRRSGREILSTAVVEEPVGVGLLLESACCWSQPVVGVSLLLESACCWSQPVVEVSLLVESACWSRPVVGVGLFLESA
jgi:hypothetical protein